MFCQHCGKENSLESRFCSICGGIWQFHPVRYRPWPPVVNITLGYPTPFYMQGSGSVSPRGLSIC
ncbi:MAG: zinc ribbon domain-containing protein [Chromatium okenii]|nr:zinc ribbon domain-containing protein [Chromatium okenii]